MHKAVMLIVKAEDRADALDQARSHMEEYGEGNVWDWYAIGGRWSRTLNPLTEKFNEKAKELVKKEGQDFISTKDVENNDGNLQKLWNDMGGTQKHPWSDHYKLPEDGLDDDVMPLKTCFDIVKSWEQTVETAKKAEEKAKEWLNGTRAKDDYSMYGYCLKCAAELYRQSFCFECNVYNIENYNYSIPAENIEDYWVVMIDMHN